MRLSSAFAAMLVIALPAVAFGEDAKAVAEPDVDMN